jgi:hypothetical protein
MLTEYHDFNSYFLANLLAISQRKNILDVAVIGYDSREILKPLPAFHLLLTDKVKSIIVAPFGLIHRV